jgi:RimJ/RimL family protein N-acetyltransferase
MGIYLRRTRKSDLDFVLDAELSDGNSSFVIAWTYEQHKQALSNKDLLHLIVGRCEDNKPIGYIILAGLDSIHQSIEFRRIVITDKGKGYGIESLRLIKKMAFEELSAHRLWPDVEDHNLRARHVYEAEGFIFEGVLRECLKIGEKFESLVVLSMLQSEYQCCQNQNS